jgi:hypothetical protein
MKKQVNKVLESVVEEIVSEEKFSGIDFLTAEKVFGRGRKARVLTSSAVGGLSSYLGWVYGVATVGLNPAAAVAYGAFNGLVWMSATYGASVAMKEMTILHRIKEFTENELGEALKEMVNEAVDNVEALTPTSN